MQCALAMCLWFRLCPAGVVESKVYSLKLYRAETIMLSQVPAWARVKQADSAVRVTASDAGFQSLFLSLPVSVSPSQHTHTSFAGRETVTRKQRYLPVQVSNVKKPSSAVASSGRSGNSGKPQSLARKLYSTEPQAMTEERP